MAIQKADGSVPSCGAIPASGGRQAAWMCVIESETLEPQCSMAGKPQGLNSSNLFSESSPLEAENLLAQPTITVKDGYPCGQLRIGRPANVYLPPCFFGRDSHCYVGLSAIDGETGICANETCSFSGPLPWDGDASRVAALTRGTCKRC